MCKGPGYKATMKFRLIPRLLTKPLCERGLGTRLLLSLVNACTVHVHVWDVCVMYVIVYVHLSHSHFCYSGSGVCERRLYFENSGAAYIHTAYCGYLWDQGTCTCTYDSY